jgi:hypothetical protein
MPKYGISHPAFVTTTALKSVLGAYMLTTLTMDVEIVEVVATGAGATAAADTQHRAQLMPFTFGATGVSTSITPINFNSRAGAALGNYGANYTTEPTATAVTVPLQFGFNQRGGMRWAVPQGEGAKYSSDATTTHRGATIQIISAVAGVIDGNMHFWQGN